MKKNILLLLLTSLSAIGFAEQTVHIDAAYYHSASTVYFFYKDNVINYDFSQHKVASSKKLNQAYPSLTFDRIDAALDYGNGKVYLFRGNQYVRVDKATNQVDPGYPKATTSAWKGLPASSWEAAFSWGNSSIFIKSKQTYRYDNASTSVTSNSPQAFDAAHWPNLPFGYLDAGFNHKGKGRTYLFNDDSYCRIDNATGKIEEGYPKSLTKWGDLYSTIEALQNGVALTTAAPPRVQNNQSTNSSTAASRVTIPELQWGTASKSKSDAGILDLATDASGNIYVCGAFGASLEVGSHTATCSYDKKQDPFIAKFSPSGQILWLKNISSKEKDHVVLEHIAVDRSGNVVVFGLGTGNINVDLNGGSKYLQLGGPCYQYESCNQEFVVKYSPSMNIVWTKTVKGGGFYSDVRDMVVDSKGNVFIKGYGTGRVFDMTYAYGSYVAKLSASGEVKYANKIGETNCGLAIGPNDELVVGFASRSDFKYEDINGNTKTIALKSKSYVNGWGDDDHYSDAHVAVFDNESGKVKWIKSINGSNEQNISLVTVDKEGNITVIGSYNVAASVAGQKSLATAKPEKEASIFMAQFSMSGQLRWVKSLDEYGYFESATVDAVGDIYFTYSDCDDHYSWAVYLRRYDKNGKLVFKDAFGRSNGSNCGFWKSHCGTANFFVFSAANSMYLCGEGDYFYGSDFDLSDSGKKEFEGGAGTDYFLCKYTVAK